MKATLNDFEIKFKRVSLLCDNESAIKLINNPVQHAKTKHIDVRHYFIKDHQQKGDICIESVGTEDRPDAGSLNDRTLTGCVRSS